MKLWVVAVGQRLPAWAETAVNDYHKRFGGDLKVQLLVVKTEPRAGRPVQTLWALERQRIEAAIASHVPRGARWVVLDERGEDYSTVQLAQKITQWQGLGDDVVFIIGGPDGLDPALKKQAHQQWRLSSLTLPHAMVRVLLLEQLYRAWSINANHPYHRE